MRGLRERWVGQAGFAPLIFSIGLSLFCLVLWAGWTGYSQLESTQSELTQVVSEGLGAGVVTPTTAGGGYENETYGGTAPPAVDLVGVETMMTTVAQNAMPSSTITLTTTGFIWTLPPAGARSWDVAGPIQVTNIHETSTAPLALDATITAPESFELWGFQTIRVTFQTTVSVPIAGQTASNQFQSY